MSLFMDVHNIEGGVSVSDVIEAHQKDLETQDKLLAATLFGHVVAGLVVDGLGVVGGMVSRG